MEIKLTNYFPRLQTITFLKRHHEKYRDYFFLCCLKMRFYVEHVNCSVDRTDALCKWSHKNYHEDRRAEEIKKRGHTHVVLVFGHGCHSVFMGTKLHICFSSRLAVRSHIDVDSQWIQRREKLQEQRKTDTQMSIQVEFYMTILWVYIQ